MKILYTHPGKSCYHDNGIWIAFPIASNGFWLFPGQSIAVINTPPKTIPHAPWDQIVGLRIKFPPVPNQPVNHEWEVISRFDSEFVHEGNLISNPRRNKFLIRAIGHNKSITQILSLTHATLDGESRYDLADLSIGEFYQP